VQSEQLLIWTVSISTVVILTISTLASVILTVVTSTVVIWTVVIWTVVVWAIVIWSSQPHHIINVRTTNDCMILRKYIFLKTAYVQKYPTSSSSKL
jgi:hypothetical protein